MQKPKKYHLEQREPEKTAHPHVWETVTREFLDIFAWPKLFIIKHNFWLFSVDQRAVN